MTDELRYQLAERAGESLALRREVQTLPVDPFAIAAARGIVVEMANLSSAFGCLVKAGDVFGIYYASDLQNEGVIRFTIAHELGHYFLEGHAERLFPGGDGRHVSQSGFVSSDPHEREADHFAVGLLMPKKLFVAELRKSSGGFAAVEHMRSICRTSITATAIRYATLAEDPVAIIVSERQTIRYCFMSECLREIQGLEWLGKRMPVPRDSATAAFNQNSDNVRLGKQVEGSSSLDSWFSGAPDAEMQEDVVGLGRYGCTLTVLFSDKAIDADESEDNV